MKAKYTFTKQPPKGEYGRWETADGFKCFTNERKTAIRWYKDWIFRKKH